MASWVGVTTNAGARLMANWTSGTVLNIDMAVAGTGIASAVSLLAQTALVEEKQKISIVSSKVENDARKIKIQIQAHEEGYVLNQIGLVASLDGGEQVLLALFQNERGIAIPSVAESPDFLYTFYCFLTVSNQGEFSITVDTSALVAYGTMQDFVAKEIESHNADENSHEDIRKAVQEQAKKPFFVISDVEPETGPVLWFDTSINNRQEENILLLELGGEGDEALTAVTAEISGEGFPVLNADISEAQTEGTYYLEIT